MKQVLVTGATGFMGKHLVRSLIAEGYHVIATHRIGSDLTGFANMQDALEWVEMDSTDTWCKSLCDKPNWDTVIHLATDYGRQSDTVASIVATNVLFPIRLLEIAIERRVELFVNTDTCFSVDYPYLRPYTLSKKQFAKWGEVLTDNTDTRFLTLELQHPYGPGDGPGKFVPWIIDQCLHSSEPIRLTSGRQEKDFIFVDDVINAYLTLIRRWREIASETLVIPCGTGKPISVRDLVECVHRQCSSDAKLEFGALPDRPREIMRSVADISILSQLGWTPVTSLAEGIGRTFNEAIRAEPKIGHRSQHGPKTVG